MSVEERLQEILALHFDPEWGAPYWLHHRNTLPFPIEEVRSVHDLRRFPPFPRTALCTLPVESFVPRRFHKRLSDFITCETGGATGPPARTVFRQDEFHAAFVAPFLAAAEIMAFPRHEHWLFVGPSGPHPIGKAARLCANAMDSIDPFMVDFDPRWARKLGEFALNRYLEHVLAQAMAILTTQHVGVIFATPPVLSELGTRLDLAVRAQIQGIHTGGIAPERSFWARLSEEYFPNAKVMSGYGNSLAGMCPQLWHDANEPPHYFPQGTRLLMDVMTHDANTGNGCIRFHRLDESCFLPNVVERDWATQVQPPAAAAAQGFSLPGVCDPRPAPEATVTAGLY